MNEYFFVHSVLYKDFTGCQGLPDMMDGESGQVENKRSLAAAD